MGPVSTCPVSLPVPNLISKVTGPIERVLGLTSLGITTIRATQAESRPGPEEAPDSWTAWLLHSNDRTRWCTDQEVDLLMVGDSIVIGWARKAREVWKLVELEPGDLVITEIMKDPSGSDTIGEWFEIHNTGPTPVDIEGWTIQDNDFDSHVIAKRNVIKIKRVPEVLMFVLISPIMFVLLFAYVFGDSINIPGGSYREFLIGGIFAQTVIFGATFTGAGLADDMQKGIINRFRSLPMNRTAVLV